MPRERMTDEQHEARLLAEAVDIRVRRLRVVVDEIENWSSEAISAALKGDGSYRTVPQIFVKALTQALVNAGIEGLIASATAAEVYRVEASNSKNEED